MSSGKICPTAPISHDGLKAVPDRSRLCSFRNQVLPTGESLACTTAGPLQVAPQKPRRVHPRRSETEPCRSSNAFCAARRASACSMVHAFKAAKGLSSDRPSGVTLYSTPGGAVSMSLRSRMPFRSSRRRACVRVFCAMPSIRRRTSLKRNVPPAAQIAPRTRMLHRSAIWSRSSRSNSLPSDFIVQGHLEVT